MKAKWIWHHSRSAYNDTIIAKKNIRLTKFDSAKIKITADSYYRLCINGQWVGDGPCRSWHSHFQYDVIDAGIYLQKGDNEITIIARHFGIGDFHGDYQRPGLLFEMEVSRGKKTSLIISDKTWKTAAAKQYISETPKVSIQMEPAELVDARLDKNLRFTPAKEICSADKGPWQGLIPRDIPLLTLQPYSLKRFVDSNVVDTPGESFCVPAARLCGRGIIPSNCNTETACGMATLIEFRKPATLTVKSHEMRISVDGRTNKTGKYRLSAGRHLIFAMSENLIPFHSHDWTISVGANAAYKLINPLKSGFENPWAWIRLKGYSFSKDDTWWPFLEDKDPELGLLQDRYKKQKNSLFKKVKDKKSLLENLEQSLKTLSSKRMFVENTGWKFQNREIQKSCADVSSPAACISDNADVTVVKPSPEGDVELIYDLGTQNLGFWEFDLEADAGVVVDIFGVEYIFDDSRPQRTLNNINGLRYITKQGRNCYTSIKSRSGRYLYVTLRNVKNPVKIRRVGMIESTYPVQYKASFECSNPNLERIWEISEYTVKLCMQDTYVDCPLYEQTLWVGDARNESLFGNLLFGADDIALRCIRLAAESLEKYPIVNSQVPSSWGCLLPAWSFLWGISVWDHYWYTGDKKFLKDYMPYVKKNLEGALSFINDDGLYSAPHWNLFDWTDIDQGHNTVFHSSLLLAGALQAAVKCAQVTGEKEFQRLWQQEYDKLKDSINKFWDKDKRSYPDSIHNDGSISKSISQHTSFLSLLYDVCEQDMVQDCIKNTAQPSAEMIKVGSPFAIFYQYDCLEKLGLYDAIFDSIHKKYLPMIQSGATTVWECFPNSSVGDEHTDGGPTRSHCHAWSSAPVYFISRIILGIRQSSPGCESYDISPWVNNLDYAKGSIATANGEIRLNWQRDGKTLSVNYSLPSGVKARFVPNESHKGLKVIVNGRKQRA
ncbi:oligosaccharide amylase [Limihaloglobus sulfuriphilus]|uniref:Oligosaccharide amylase n=1 Tax=Limihaloglobus sulfuriphilus TaxID=1851148 RepID=A0A1Q2MEY9_9BACT|nr:alpha-L-rhamnosidase C-terminal domain-containing protein [Limihaloglobus sulfuriphilus]AQQ70857.1 oligosaccharide amylase [Limihaloglobus sulfuriphilus]